MEESARMAAAFASDFLRAHRPTAARFFDDAELHLHLPEGATPKDGPSAGAAVVTSLLSLATGTAVRRQAALTGEVTLTGKILPVGGVKEKLLAARRAGIKTVLLPEGNRRHFEELPPGIQAKLDPHFVTCYDQVFDLLLHKQRQRRRSSAKRGEQASLSEDDAAVTA